MKKVGPKKVFGFLEKENFLIVQIFFLKSEKFFIGTKKRKKVYSRKFPKKKRKSFFLPNPKKNKKIRISPTIFLIFYYKMH